MKRLTLILLLLFSQTNFACPLTFEQGQKAALETNKFMVVYFCESTNYMVNRSPDSLWLNTEDLKLLNNFVSLIIYPDFATKYLKKYKINTLPTLLIVDGNGMEIYRYSGIDKPNTIRTALQNLAAPMDNIATDLKNFNKKHEYNPAIRVAQKYFDYSLLVGGAFKKNLFALSESYIKQAEIVLLKKDKDYKEKAQKLELLGLYRFAFGKNFSFLNEKLSTYDESKIDRNNIQIFYFLK